MKNYDSSDYINEKAIKGQGNPLSIKKLKDLFEKAENSMCKILYFEKKGSGFFFSTKYSNNTI